MEDCDRVIIKLEDASLTKQDIRLKVWDHLERHNLASLPRPVHNRIPNFIGASAAGQKLAQIEEFKSAKVVKVNPDKPQEEVRLFDGDILPYLKFHLFQVSSARPKERAACSHSKASLWVIQQAPEHGGDDQDRPEDHGVEERD